jgi:hypothetical protein
MRRARIVLLVLVGVASGGWVTANQSGRFGISGFGLTTYSRLPLPAVDLQVRSDATLRWVTKSHDVDATTLAWLTSEQKPDVLIIALGWRGAMRTPDNLEASLGIPFIALPTDKALSLYNSLRDAGKRVAIHVHSTC